MNFVKPKVVSSRCIEFDACRYDAHMISSDFVRMLKPFVDFMPICPEFEIGLGVPRDPIRIVRMGKEDHLLQPSTETDLTDRMAAFSESFLSSLKAVDGFILKFRSPSCGMKDVKVYSTAGKGRPLARRPGFFGSAVLRRYSDLAVEDEGRLRNLRIREQFLTKLFTLAAFREVVQQRSPAGLVSFHSENKYLLMAYDQKEASFLGRVVANQEKLSFDCVISYYRDHLHRALTTPPRSTTNINVLMHAMGHFKDHLNSREKEYFMQTVERYRNGKIPLSAASSVVKGWVERFDDAYLREQTFFQPYPEELIEICSV